MKNIVFVVFFLNSFMLFSQNRFAFSSPVNTITVYAGAAQTASSSGSPGVGLQINWMTQYTRLFTYGFSGAYNQVNADMNVNRYLYTTTLMNNQTVYNATTSHLNKKTFNSVRLSVLAKQFFSDNFLRPYIFGGAGLSVSSVKELSSVNSVVNYTNKDNIPGYYTQSEDQKDLFIKPLFETGAGIQWAVSETHALDLQYQYIIYAGLFHQHFLAVGFTL